MGQLSLEGPEEDGEALGLHHEAPAVDRRNYRRASSTLPGFNRGRTSASKGKTFTTEILTGEELQRLLTTCPHSLVGRRLHGMVSLLYRTGMELSEAINARVGDLHLGAEAAIDVRPTRLRPRRLALDDELLEVLIEWLELRSALPGDHLFPIVDGPTAGQAWDRSDVNRAFRELGKEALGRRFHPGALRLTLTAELIVEQWPLPYIQTQLGLSGIWSFREIFPKLGIEAADESDAEALARLRPAWGGPSPG